MKIFYLVLLLLIPQADAYLIINEINYNPEGNDNNQEYIEIISNETINLTDYTIQDLSSEDALQPLQELNTTYALIVEEGFNITSINSSIYTVGKTIGNDLNNDHDAIILKDQNSQILDILSYSNNLGGNGNSKSLCKMPDASYILKECNPTPGEKNTDLTYEPEDIDLEITEFLPDPLGQDNAVMPEGEWIEIYNKKEKELNMEGFFFKDNANHKLVIDNTRTTNTTIQPKEYLLIYVNGFSGLLNNENLEIISLYDKSEKELDRVSYSSSDEGLSWSKISNIWQLTLPTPQKENTKIEKEQLSSSITIDSIYDGSDEKVLFGQQVNLKITVYKGNTSKYSITTYIEDNDKEKISKTSKFNLYEKFMNYTVTIPIQIFPNCKKSLKDGTYNVIVSGLDSEAEKEIRVEDTTKDLCQETEVIVEKTTKTISTKQAKEDSDFETVINHSQIPEIIYESTNTKSKSLGVYILAFILVLIIVTKTIKHENSNKNNN